ncbi:MAG: FtsX-like permease family protein, partial [Nanoarchaeota archaeon]
GVMKAIGAQNKDILALFLIESGTLGLIGGVLGILFGFTITQTIEYIAINQLSTTLLATATPLWLILGSLAFAFFVGAVSGFLPAWQATKIKPVEALRYE